MLQMTGPATWTRTDRWRPLALAALAPAVPLAALARSSPDYSYFIDEFDVRFVTGDGEYSRRMTLARIAAQLDPECFLQINRSAIVRLDAVAEFQPWFHSDYRVVMKSGAHLTWSRRYRAKTDGTLSAAPAEG